MSICLCIFAPYNLITFQRFPGPTNFASVADWFFNFADGSSSWTSAGSSSALNATLEWKSWLAIITITGSGCCPVVASLLLKLTPFVELELSSLPRRGVRSEDDVGKHSLYLGGGSIKIDQRIMSNSITKHNIVENKITSEKCVKRGTFLQSILL